MAQGIPLSSNSISAKQQPHSTQQDPYFLVKNNVTESITKTKQYAQEFTNLPFSTPLSQINQKLAQLQTQLQTIQTDIEDIQDSIQIVEQHPNRFKLTKEEIANRKMFLEWCKTNLNEIQSMKLSGQAKFEKFQRDSLLKASPKQAAQINSTASALDSKPKSSSFIETHTGQQQVLIQQQDEQLDSVLHTVTNMKEVALTMGQELDDQVGLLHEMDQNVDSTQLRLTSAMQRIKLILKKNDDTKATCIIIALIIVLIILLIFIVI